MVGRILDTLRSGVVGDGERPPRPNELRRETVRADRLRREQAPGARPSPSQPRRPAAPPPVPAGPAALTVAPARRHPLAIALASRGGLRHAVLMTEILGPPKALRDPERDLPGSRG